jgi:hypothetical protein
MYLSPTLCHMSFVAGVAALTLATTGPALSRSAPLGCSAAWVLSVQNQVPYTSYYLDRAHGTDNWCTKWAASPVFGCPRTCLNYRSTPYLR